MKNLNRENQKFFFDHFESYLSENKIFFKDLDSENDFKAKKKQKIIKTSIIYLLL